VALASMWSSPPRVVVALASMSTHTAHKPQTIEMKFIPLPLCFADQYIIKYWSYTNIECINEKIIILPTLFVWGVVNLMFIL
jgi:hypothetical protein